MAKIKKKRTALGLTFLTILVWVGCSKLVLDKESKKKTQSVQSSSTENKVKTVADSFEEKEKNMGATYVEKNERREKVTEFCKKIEKRFTKYGWGKSKCMNYPWNFVRTSVKGDPLIWMTFGNETEKRKETTLILCGVHGDEITPIKFCFDILDHMNSVAAGTEKNHEKDDLKDRLVLIAPIVNPDSFFKKWPTRTNANGIDVNRNFPTRDFNSQAMKLWKGRYKKDKRRYPGKVAMSEPETLFQVNLLKRYNPDKIISVHAPLTMLDYDGPADRHAGGVVGSSANQLLMQMSEQAKGYKIKNYPFFPGSLGNYAGNERNIPTYTLELPSSDNRKSKKYWRLFKDAIHSAIMHKMDKEMEVARDERAPSDSSKQN
ncbi:MAG: hypothetical protein CME70_16505 [Halobacteriovorax sp.]|nr:hypothetical protein [Halobacteriovorax sp.]|tara:strand:+ start:44657 stop:45781 length:1125 start_codon:yes stop_codon:yes gene_type:complete